MLASPAVQTSGSSELAALLRLLQERGLVVGGDADTVTVAPRHHDGPGTALDLPEELLADYLDRLGRSYAPFDDDPRAAARGLVAVRLADDLMEDHGGGTNRIRRVALVAGSDGAQWAEERSDDPGPSPTPDGVPHDDPDAFAAELDALAQFLRGQGLDAVADPRATAMRVGTAGRPPDARELALDLHPDRYRRWFAVKEDEFEAIGGEPRDHAWRLWCRLVLSILTDGPGTPHRLSFAESPEGEVSLVADADGDEPPEARYEWSTEPGA